MAYRPAILDFSLARSDLQAGLTVAIVALPLSMAIAIASGIGPDKGLITAIIGGFLVSALGGTRHQIGGPAGAFIILVAACVAQIGVEGLILATLMSGLILALAGAFRLGGIIRYVPYPVILGFTAGIAVIIAASQLGDLLGLVLTRPEPGPLLPKLAALWQARGSLQPASVIVSVLTIALIVLLQRHAPRAPAMLIAIIIATLIALVLPAQTVADRFGQLPGGLPMPQMPQPTAELLWAALPFAVSFAILGAIESLLSALVADQMAGTRMRADDELIGQGLANMAVAMFGGFCTTGTIARTATNIRAGSSGPASGMIHSVILLVVLAVAAPLAGRIPLAGLAGLLMVVAWKMVEWNAIAALVRISRADAAIVAITFLTVVLRDLIEGIVLGVALAGIAFVARMAGASQAVPAGGQDGAHDRQHLVWHLRGPVFFGSVARIESLLDQIRYHPRLLVLDMKDVPMMDSTGARMIEELAGRLHHRGTRLVVAGAGPDLRQQLPGLEHSADIITAEALISS